MNHPFYFDWKQGISADVVSRVLKAALAQGFVGERSAMMFHDLDAFSQRINYLKACFPPQTLHTLAIKANPLVELLCFATQHDMGLEAASIEEVALARAAGCPPARIVFDSPAKTRAEISQALSWGVTLNADSLQELERIHDILGTAGRNSSSLIGLRINPQVGEGRIGMLSVSGRYSKFGVALGEYRADIIAAFRRYPWLRGLHVHVGSQGVSEQLMATAVSNLFDLREEIHAELGGIRIESVDIGGGLPWRYHENEAIATPDSYSALLAKTVPQCFADNIRLVTEFGRAMQTGCGFAVSRVEYVKTDGGRRTAVIHFGADLMMRRVYQPDAWYHHISVLAADATLKTGDELPHNVVGPLCFGGDILGENVQLPRVEEGDWVVLHDVGGYTLSMWSRHCNRVLPLVLGYMKEPMKFKVLFNGENLDDIVRFWGRRLAEDA